MSESKAAEKELLSKRIERKGNSEKVTKVTIELIEAIAATGFTLNQISERCLISYFTLVGWAKRRSEPKNDSHILALKTILADRLKHLEEFRK